MRVNVGCGQGPTPGWHNFDNSLSLWLARYSFLVAALRRFRLLDDFQINFICFSQANHIEYGDIVKGLAIQDGVVEVLYASHVLEHLDREEVSVFLKEAKRLLRPGGILRLAVPDIRLHVEEYLESRDADRFIEATLLAQPKPRSLASRLRLLLMGGRHHHWMYDGESLSRALIKSGFHDPRVLEPGQTTIPNPGELNLAERVEESVYVEARKPE